ncbi:hypothetical protein, partial [Glutamicibacter soli]|uniref:hypothetical protein n=1 Tax=Glutamicibacter soli TaxID=453836 RepID=UPI001F1D60E6
DVALCPSVFCKKTQFQLPWPTHLPLRIFSQWFAGERAIRRCSETVIGAAAANGSLVRKASIKKIAPAEYCEGGLSFNFR